MALSGRSRVGVALLAIFAAAAVGCGGDSGDDTDGAGADLSAAADVEPEPTGVPSRHAIVLAHGFNASDTNMWSWNGVAEALAKDGHVVHKALVQPYRGVADRAEELAKHIDQARAECKAKPPCDASKVHLVAHSMGGLDARFVVSKLSNADGTPYSKLVASVTTISSPHHGTAIADTVLGLTPGVAGAVVNALAGLWAKTFTSADLAEGSDVFAALTDLSEASSDKFNADVPNADGVFYQSWAGITNPLSKTVTQKELDACEGHVETFQHASDNLLDHGALATAQFLVTAPIIGHGVGSAGDPNDAFVRVESAKWGVFHGCIPADHMDEVGQRTGSDKPNATTHFFHIPFYRRLAFGLDAASGAHDG